MMRQGGGSGTRQDILVAAAEIIGAYGYSSASVERIITLARVQPGELYAQFDSKDTLAREIIALRDQRAARIRRAAAGSGTPALEKLIDESMALASMRDTDAFCLAGDRLLREVDDGWEEVAASRGRDRAEFSRLLHDARRQGHIRVAPDADADDDALAQMVLAAVIGAGVSARALRDARDAVTVLEIWWQLVVPGLVPADLLPGYIEMVGGSARRHRRQRLL
ncbi:TetR/AcrR family transcriptional regulator [Tomitella cavernea]|nr:TetR/AcrR family transcriptional regulator [Tomitella cavernea]